MLLDLWPRVDEVIVLPIGEGPACIHIAIAHVVNVTSALSVVICIQATETPVTQVTAALAPLVLVVAAEESLSPTTEIVAELAAIVEVTAEPAWC